MPTQKTITYSLYTFDELDDDAKEKAREWYRPGALDYDWWDSVYEDATTIGALMGVTIERIYFSGFASQGDGANFTGSYEYAKGSVAAVKKHAPQAEGLHAIAKALQLAQSWTGYRTAAKIGCYSGYTNSAHMHFNGFEDVPRAAANVFVKELCAFADWIYCNLEAEHDWLLSDEQIDEIITTSEYTFDEKGAYLNI